MSMRLQKSKRREENERMMPPELTDVVLRSRSHVPVTGSNPPTPHPQPHPNFLSSSYNILWVNRRDSHTYASPRAPLHTNPPNSCNPSHRQLRGMSVEGYKNTGSWRHSSPNSWLLARRVTFAPGESHPLPRRSHSPPAHSHTCGNSRPQQPRPQEIIDQSSGGCNPYAITPSRPRDHEGHQCIRILSKSPSIGH